MIHVPAIVEESISIAVDVTHKHKAKQFNDELIYIGIA
jgi:hypothetical protein